MARLWRVLMIRAIVVVGKTATPKNSHIVEFSTYCYSSHTVNQYLHVARHIPQTL
jgi:hypothetical protein